MLRFLQANWGNLASVVGLIVSSLGLAYAIKAEIAASRAANTAASALAAAEAARAAARRQSLVDDLHDAQSKMEHVGVFLARQNWELVVFCSQQAVSACSQIMRRWGSDTLTSESRDGILRSQQQIAIISKIAVRASAVAPSNQEVKRMATAQQKAFETLSGELAQSLHDLERVPR